MATAILPEPKTTALDPRVSHPLDRLRGIIRRYVVIEGALSAVLFLASWFTLGLLIDFGLFRVAVWDWVLDAPWTLRLIALLVGLCLFVSLISARIVRRLSKELSYPALAMVLERRYPKLLGDRLITAVELADVSRAEKDGYSAEMVRQTILEARARVEEVDVQAVFNWRRLWRLGFTALAMLVGIVVLGYVAFAASSGSSSVYRYGWRLAHVTGTILERDLLLKNTPWPRRAHLELVGFPTDEPLRVGKDGGAPSVRVRSFRYVLADSNVPLGWRPMKWNDLNEKYVSAGFPTDPFAEFDSVDGVATAGAGAWTIDDVWNRTEAVAAKASDAKKQIESLDEKALALQVELKQRTADIKKQAEDLKASAAIKMTIAIERKDAKDSKERLEEAKKMQAEALAMERNHAEIALQSQVLIRKPDGGKWEIKPVNSLEWRPLHWGDLKTALNMGTAATAPTSMLKGQGEGDPTVSAVSENLPKIESQLEPVRSAISHLDATCDKPSMGRTVRKLDTPGKVVLEYVGKTKTGDATLNAEQNNEFAGQVTELKEDIRFTVKAEDFRTDPREIHLINPPMFEKLIRTDFQPAYLHHAPPLEDGYDAFKGIANGKHEPLQGKGVAPLQRMRDMTLSLTGDRTVFSVPVGTAVQLTGLADTELRAAYLEPKVGILPGAIPSAKNWIPLPLGEDRRTITIDLSGDYRLAPGREFWHVYLDEAGWVCGEMVTSPAFLEFDIVLEHKFGVISRRQMNIQTAEDEGPDVNVMLDGVRRVAKLQVFVNNKLLDITLPVPCYLITPEALLEFHPDSSVKDDHGLSKVAYEGKYWLQSYQEEADKAKVIEAPPDRRTEFSAPLPQFTGLGQGRPRAELKALLAAPLRDEDRVKQVTLVEYRNTERDTFDMLQLKLAAEDKKKGQLHYRVDLGVVATDANFATGPRTARNREPINLLLVSEAELRMAMNADEEKISRDLGVAVKAISDARTKIDFVRSQNRIVPLAEVATSRLKTDEIVKDLINTRNNVQGVLADCRRLHRECKINRVAEASTTRYGRLGNRVDRLLGNDPLPINPKEAEDLKDGLLKPKGTFPFADAAISDLFNQLIPPGMDPPTPGQWADPAVMAKAEQALADLEQELVSIQNEVGKSSTYQDTVAKFELMVRARLRQTSELDLYAKRLEEEQTGKFVTLLPPGPVFLAKGETKKAKLNIKWNQFPKDDCVVKVESSENASVGVTPELKLNFEKHQTDFELELKAMQNVGDYVVTLTPEAGKPIQVMVKVR